MLLAGCGKAKKSPGDKKKQADSKQRIKIVAVKEESLKSDDPIAVANFNNPFKGQIPDYIDITLTKPLKGVGDLKSKLSISISPSAAIDVTRISDNEFRIFFPSGLLHKHSSYTFKILGGEFRLHVPQFRVEEIRQDALKKPVFRISFNSPVDAAQLKSALQVSYKDRKGAPFKIITKGSAKNHKIKATKVSHGDRIHFLINKALRDSYGNSLDHPFEEMTTVNLRQLRLYIVNHKFNTNDDSFDLLLQMRQEDAKNPGKYEQGSSGRWRYRYVPPGIDVEVFQRYLEIEPKVRFTVMCIDDWYRVKGDFKPQTDYHITIKKGLYSNDGKVMEKDYDFKHKLGNFKTSLQILSKGHIVPEMYENKINLKTVNIKEARLKIRHIHEQNIHFWLTDQRNYPGGNISDQICNEIIKFDSKQNKPLFSILDLSQFIPESGRGVFQISIDGTSGARDKVQLIMSDLAINLKKESAGGYKLWVRSFKDMKSVSGAKVKAMSYSNVVLAEKDTNMEGEVTFDGIKANIFIVSKGDDLNYITMDEPKVDLSMQDTGGEPYSTESSYRCFVYTDRGVYRPNDTANISILLRDKDAWAPSEEFTLTAKLLNPRGKVIESRLLKVNDTGMGTFNKVFGNFPVTGSYSVQIYFRKKIIGTGNFKVEEFVPERIKASISPAKKIFSEKDVIKWDFNADFLFGAPAADSKYELGFSYVPVAVAYETFPGFRFGKHFDRSPSKTYLDTIEGKLNKKGKGNAEIDLEDQGIKAQTPMDVTASLSVFEMGSGRTTRAFANARIIPGNFLIGVKPEVNSVGRGTKAAFQGVLVDSSGELKKWSGKIDVKVQRVRYEWYYYYDEYTDYGYNWQWMPYKYVVQQEQIEAKDGKFTYTLDSDSNWGAYLISFTDEKGKVITEYFMPCRWEWRYSRYYSSQRANELRKYRDPEYLEVRTDKDKYKEGDLVKVSITPKFDGLLLLSFESDRVLFSKWLKVKEGRNDIEFKIKDYIPNGYIVAHFFRDSPTKASDGFQPFHAIGVKNITIEPEKHTLQLEMEVPEKILPNSELTVTVKVPASEKKAYVTIAAVDEGILQLTSFKTPDPTKFFFAKRALGVNSYANYGWLMGRPSKEELSGGDADAAAAGPQGKQRVSPIRIVSLWSGILPFDKGKAEITFKVPYFNGSLRIMALASSEKRFASEEKTTIVRDPLVMMPSVPRFLTIGDKIRIPVSITNMTGKKGQITYKLSVEGGATLEGEDSRLVELGKEDSHIEYFTINVQELAGTVKLNFHAAGNGAITSDTLEIPIIPPLFQQTRIKRVKLAKGTNNISQYFSGWVPEYEMDTILVNPVGFLNGIMAIKRLVRYPYGCIEQTTSATFPLLYISDILDSIDPEILKGRDVHKMVMQGIGKVISMQQLSGGFSYWPGGRRVSEWSSIYATHMLLEASKAGYTVPKEVLESALNYVQDMAFYYNYRNYKAYSYYVLALAGKKNVNRIRKAIKNIRKYSKETRSEELFLLSAALILSGEKSEGMKLITPLFNDIPEFKRYPNKNFYSTLRYLGLKLFIMEEIDPAGDWGQSTAEAIARMLDRFTRYYYYTTQELAWSVCGLGKRLHNMGDQRVKKATLIAADKKYPLKKCNAGLVLSGTGFSGMSPLELNTDGAGYAYLSTTGYPLDFSRKVDYNGLKVKVIAKDIKGNPVQLTTGVKIGDLIVFHVSIENLASSKLNDVALTVRIPSGFDIENPRLKGGHVISWVNENTLWNYEHMDIRDERIQLFGDLPYHQTKHIYFAVRASFSGGFTMPGASAEVMYDPQYYYFGELADVNIGE